MRREWARREWVKEEERRLEPVRCNGLVEVNEEMRLIDEHGDEAVYDLVTATLQLGNSKDGHYTTWVRERPSPPGGEAEGDLPPPQPRWTQYDDTVVTPGHANLPDSVARSGYLLFYEQTAAPPGKGHPPGPPRFAPPGDPHLGAPRGAAPGGPRRGPGRPPRARRARGP